MATKITSSPGPATSATTVSNMNKRKRPAGDDAGRNTMAAGAGANTENETYSALLNEITSGAALGNDDSTRTAQAALASQGMNNSSYPEPNTFDGNTGLPTFDDPSPSTPAMGSSAQALYDARQGQGQGGNKPSVGTPEWHQIRKDNHKEVERRRREVINEGIENIAKLVPCTEKNKGAILQRTHQYILELQQKEAAWVSERATFDIALKELTSRMDRMKESNRNAWAESAKWQQRCRDAGLHFDDYDDNGLPTLEDEAVDVDVSNLTS